MCLVQVSEDLTGDGVGLALVGLFLITLCIYDRLQLISWCSVSGMFRDGRAARG